ncbi:CRPV-210 [Crowpox virus]|nr:CRPV-210 [Crowpox virus]
MALFFIKIVKRTYVLNLYFVNRYRVPLLRNSLNHTT